MTRSTATPVHFRHTRWRSGYDPGQVDEFVETVEDALRSPTPLLTSAEVARQRFTPVLLKPGYDMDDVDDYLADAEHRLTARERLG
jgi:DivIVA domain-containing protein